MGHRLAEARFSVKKTGASIPWLGKWVSTLGSPVLGPGLGAGGPGMNQTQSQRWKIAWPDGGGL